ncbi:uncharacterized protein APUU_21471A [Aspergillus puulaauensis]|uniref:CCHC-type domain-containing protein n=1 Tax=Aspergillus puulaauensis TaxID=1220207 RepID=A0A7R8AIS8_9EURO|nr:uncharacterized protein APUU_21471A [Aspergillus puulaauensis]BCS21039.1 hypothetical protein APUU_21471A [Aspergillus puulaauensis]
MAKSFMPDEERIHCKRCGTCGVTLRTCPQCEFCVFCKKDGHTVAECPKVRPCPICNLKGHQERKCPELSHGPGRLSRAKGWKKPHGSKSVLRDEQPKKDGTSIPPKASQKRKRSGDDDSQVRKQPAAKVSSAKHGDKC